MLSDLGGSRIVPKVEDDRSPGGGWASGHGSTMRRWPARLIWGKQRLSNPRLLIVVDCVAAALIGAAALVSLASLHISASLILVIGTVVVGSATVALRRAVPYPAALVALVSVVAYERLTHQAITDLVPAFTMLLTTYTAAAQGIGRHDLGRLVGLVGILLWGDGAGGVELPEILRGCRECRRLSRSSWLQPSPG